MQREIAWSFDISSEWLLVHGRHAADKYITFDPRTESINDGAVVIIPSVYYDEFASRVSQFGGIRGLIFHDPVPQKFIDVLPALKALRSLLMWETRAEDLSALATLRDLEHVGLARFNKCHSLSFLRGLKSLEFLSLGLGKAHTDLSHICGSNLPELVRLELFMHSDRFIPRPNSLDPIASCANLATLWSVARPVSTSLMTWVDHPSIKNLFLSKRVKWNDQEIEILRSKGVKIQLK